jgi:uncharacterized protein DUF4440
MPNKQEILHLEYEFWDAFQKNDAATAARLTDEQCVLTGAQGAAMIHPADFAPMMQQPQYVLLSYQFDESSIQFLPLGDDEAVIAYRVTEDLTVEGEPVTLEAFDSSLWRRREGRWVCSLHTESIAGDPFGRDRK